MRYLRALAYELTILVVGGLLVTLTAAVLIRSGREGVRERFVDDQFRPLVAPLERAFTRAPSVQAPLPGGDGTPSTDRRSLQQQARQESEHWEKVRGSLRGHLVEVSGLETQGSLAPETVESYEAFYRATRDLTFFLFHGFASSVDLLSPMLNPREAPWGHAFTRSRGGRPGASLASSGLDDANVPVLIKTFCAPGFADLLASNLRSRDLDYLVEQVPRCSGDGVVLVPAAQPPQDMGSTSLRRDFGFLLGTETVPWDAMALGCPRRGGTEPDQCAGFFGAVKRHDRIAFISALFQSLSAHFRGGVVQKAKADESLGKDLSALTFYLSQERFWRPILYTTVMILIVLGMALLLGHYRAFSFLLGQRRQAEGKSSPSRFASSWLLPALFTLPPFVVGTLLVHWTGRDPAFLSEWTRMGLVLVASLIANLAAFDIGNSVVASIQQEGTRPYMVFLATLGVRGAESGIQAWHRRAILNLRLLFHHTGHLIRLFLLGPRAAQPSHQRKWPTDYFLLRAIQDRVFEYTKKRITYVLDAFIVLQLIFEAETGLYSQLSFALASIGQTTGSLSPEMQLFLGQAIVRFLIGVLLCSVTVRVIGTVVQIRIGQRG